MVLAGIAILTTVLSSLLPALLVARANPQAALQSASRGIGSRSVSGKLSGALVAGEVALSTLLLVGTGLLFHTLWNLEQSRLGFDYGARNHLHRHARGCGWFFRHGGFRGHGECAGFSGGRLSTSPRSTACARCPGLKVPR